MEAFTRKLRLAYEKYIDDIKLLNDVKVLEREFSKKFDIVYEAASETRVSLLFRDISEHPNPHFRMFVKRSREGMRETIKNDPPIAAIYLDNTLEDEELEKVRAREMIN